MSPRSAAMATWATAWVNTSPAMVPLAVGDGRQGRVVVGRHLHEAEPRRATGHRDLVALGRDVDRLARQVAGDVGEQPAEDEHGAALGDLGRDGDLGGDLVVERRQGQGALVVGLDEHTGEDRHRRAGRQASGHPGHGVGEDLTFDPKLHRDYLPFACGPAASKLQECDCALTLVLTVRSANPDRRNPVSLAVCPGRVGSGRGRIGTRGGILVEMDVVVVIGGVDPVDDAHRCRSARRVGLCMPGGRAGGQAGAGLWRRIRRPHGLHTAYAGCPQSRRWSCTGCPPVVHRCRWVEDIIRSEDGSGRPNTYPQSCPQVWTMGQVPRLSRFGRSGSVLELSTRARANDVEQVNRPAHLCTTLWRTPRCDVAETGGATGATPAQRDCCLIRLVSSVTWL